MTLDLSFKELVDVAANPGGATGRPLLVAIDCIDEDPDQPRRTFSEQELEELSQSIAEHGVLQPIVLRRSAEDGRYVIAMGARRYRAAQRAGLREMPAFIQDAALPDRYAQMIENIQRDDLRAPEIATFIADRLDAGDTQAEISRKLGKPRDWVSRYASVQSMPDFLRARLEGSSIRALYELYQAWRTHPDEIERRCATQDSFTDAQARQLAPGRSRGGRPRQSPDRISGWATSIRKLRSPPGSSAPAQRCERPRSGHGGAAENSRHCAIEVGSIAGDQGSVPGPARTACCRSARDSGLPSRRGVGRRCGPRGRGAGVGAHHRGDPVEMNSFDTFPAAATGYRRVPAERLSHPKDGALAQQPKAERAPHSAVERPQTAGKSRSTVPVSASALVSSLTGLSVFAMPTPPRDRREQSLAQRAGALDRFTAAGVECRERWFKPTSRNKCFCFLVQDRLRASDVLHRDWDWSAWL